MRKATWWMGLAAAVGLAFGAQAAKPQIRATVVSGGVTWSYSVGEDGAIVTGADPVKGRLAVPATLGGQSVVEIGYRAFASCEELTAVEIPEGTARIGERAFQYCSALKEVSIPAGVTNVGAMAFQYCEALATLVLPQNLEDIGTNAFYYCSGLATLYVPSAWWGTAKTEAAGVGSGCRTVYGEPGRETLFFNANGGTCGTVFRSYATGQPYGWLPDAERANHTFDGWFPSTNGGTRISETNAASDTDGSREVYAHWMPLVQTVTFDGNGGTSFKQAYPCGGFYSPLPESTRPNYAFAGWWTSRYGGERITEATLVTQDRTRTLYAHWTLTEQTVLFEAQGGACDTTNRNYAVGGTYSSLPKPTLEGYDFDGWFTEPIGGDRVSAASTVTETDSRTLYAHWSLVEQVVEFDANGGVCDTESRVYAVGGTYTWLPEAERARYVFAGWWSERDGGEEVEATDTVTATRYQTLYAHWTPTEQTVTFNATEGWCGTASGVYTVGQPYAQLPEPVREHYAFAGWWSEWQDGDEVTAADTVPAWETRTLYAHWTLAEQVVTFNPNGGTCNTTTRIYAVGSPYGSLPTPEREHYAFSGWRTGDGESVTEASEVPPTETRTLYAHWTLTEQVVTFFANGGVCGTATRVYPVGESYQWLPEASREGDEWAGWFVWTAGRWEKVGPESVVTAERTRSLWALWEEPAVSLPEVEEFERDFESGGYTVRFTGEEGKNYLLQRASKLEDNPEWQTVETLEADGSGMFEMAAPVPSGWSRGFFRLAEAADWLKAYLVVDMSGGTDAPSWPVEALYDMPDGGWTDEYKTTKLVLRLLASDTFAMGSPDGELGRGSDETRHDVTLTKPYYIGVFEVTQRQWERAMGSNPSSHTGWTHPVESVSYGDIRGSGTGAGWPGNDAVDAGSFLGVLREKTGLAFDLPTEAEWEYACRAGTVSALNSGKELSGTVRCTNLDLLGRYDYNRGEYTHGMVGSYRPNAWGLYDMHGNVSEWCLDWHAADWGTAAATNPVGPVSGSYRVHRGGNWGRAARDCRSAARGEAAPSWQDAYRGLRVRCPEVPTYRLRFDGNGGIGEMGVGHYVLGNNSTLPHNGFSKVGYRFAGWATRPSGPVAYAGGASTTQLVASAGANITLYAVWSNNAYRVRFEANGGTGTMGTQAFTYDVPQALSSNAFSRKGYVHCGWAASATGVVVHADGAVVSNLTAVANGEVALYAVWEPISYRIRFGANGGNGFMEDQTCIWNAPAALQPNAFTRPLCSFAGWATNASGAVRYGDGQVVSNLTATAGDTVLLYAQWFAYTVQFHANGGEGAMEDQRFVMGLPQNLRTNAFQKQGHAFVGWATSPDGAVEYADGAAVTNLTTSDGSVVHLYAKWSPVYTVRFNANGGEGDMADQSITVGIGQPLRFNAFERRGYVFEGWATSSNGPVAYEDGAIVKDLATEPFAVVELHAVWVVGTYLIVDMSAGKLEDTIAINEGDFVYGYYGGDDFYRNLGELGYSPDAGSTNGVVVPGQALWHLDFCHGDSIVRIKLGYDDYIQSIYLLYRWGGETETMDSCSVELDGDRYELRPGESLPEHLREQLLEQLAGLPPVESLSDGQVFWGLDIWPITDDLPVRIGFVPGASGSIYDIRVGTICRFDPETQETVEQLGHLLVPPSGDILLQAAETATSWPVSALKEEPEEGWTGEHKTAKLVLRRIEAGSIAGENQTDGLEVAEPYYIGVFELTQMQAKMAEWWSEPQYYQGISRPMELEGTRPDISSMLNVLKEKTGLEFGLPTGVQWEYACRAGTMDASGETGNLDEMARYWENGGETQGHAVVGSYLPNAWGLYDMLGNVWELCAAGSSYEALGGGWGCDSQYCDPSVGCSLGRDLALASHGIRTVGCRLCLPELP